MNRSYRKPTRTNRSLSSCIFLTEFYYGVMAWKHIPLDMPLHMHTASPVSFYLPCYSISIHVYICYILHSSMNACHFLPFHESCSIFVIYLLLKPVGISVIIRSLNKIRYLPCVDFMFAYMTQRGDMCIAWQILLSYCPGILSSSLCNSFEDRKLVDVLHRMYDAKLFKFMNPCMNYDFYNRIVDFPYQQRWLNIHI